MIEVHQLPKQPPVLQSVWNVGSLLYYSAALFVVESWFYWDRFRHYYEQEELWLSTFWFGSVLFAFSHIFLVLMDSWSRYQNYKRIKDYLFVQGFKPKIARLYSGSKCQRTAFLVAARELGLEQETLRYYRRLGVRWYHFVPNFMIKDPLFMFKSYYWSRTFTEKYYKSKFDYRALGAQTVA
ncbi:hypothetical protein KHS38_20345 [Mucilaginibacter sp. Bleaf8]|uniref:hypothetical protein n=1 Tax=Mucilaginibacter sp. Bleaf8 TaxID=2834430 RepID=UPI001BCD4EEF|nr:hypothetical protein [Mucilaginibacter sp. Bleaf8]MBS7566767.1 hypothetical protein [Mucilaginibacter sp. Bleaf8]